VTKDELREIAERHAADEALYADEVNEGTIVRIAHQAHADRGALLDLLRRVADHQSEDRYQDECLFCGLLLHKGNHAPDCPAPALEALR
jgi:hypothetical protein